MQDSRLTPQGPERTRQKFPDKLHVCHIGTPYNHTVTRSALFRVGAGAVACNGRCGSHSPAVRFRSVRTSAACPCIASTTAEAPGAAVAPAACGFAADTDTPHSLHLAVMLRLHSAQPMRCRGRWGVHRRRVGSSGLAAAVTGLLASACGPVHTVNRPLATLARRVTKAACQTAGWVRSVESQSSARLAQQLQMPRRPAQRL